jgi:hypothetical protein
LYTNFTDCLWKVVVTGQLKTLVMKNLGKDNNKRITSIGTKLIIVSEINSLFLPKVMFDFIMATDYGNMAIIAANSKSCQVHIIGDDHEFTIYIRTWHHGKHFY